ncbi:hypothetical protein LUZ60_011950 [Juncus effusus]|nr:hypothetical protein LUZ60_011950 [Juncus effusus]
MAFHTRSISTPTRPHSLLLKTKEELNNLKSSLASSSLQLQIMLDALKGITYLYESINGLLCMSCNQIGLSHPQQRRLVDQELEESIKFLDICSTSKDNLSEIKSHIQDFQVVLRRCESVALKSKTRNYIHLVKKSCKDVKIQLPRRSESIDGEASAVFGIMRDAREIAISLLQSLFSFLLKQIVGQKTSKWFIVARRSTCKEDQDNLLDIASLTVNVEGLENVLECLFRHMIQCRVSFLNICSS